MAVDRNGATVLAGQIYLVAGPVRRIDGDTVVIVLDSGQVVRAAAADICKVDDALAGGGGGVTAHNALTGLSADDHPHYVLANGTRAFTGPVAGVAPVGISDFTTKNYADTQDLVVFNYHEATKQPLDATLTALAGLSTSAGNLVKATGVDTFAMLPVTGFAETLLDDATATAARATLGLVTIANTGSASDLTSGTLPDARMPALTGDVTSSAGAVATTLSNSGVAAGTYTNPTVTFDAKGRATSASNGTAGGDDTIKSDGPMQDVAVNVVAYTDLVSKSVTVAAGDTFVLEVEGRVLNNSGVARTYRAQAELSVGVNLLNVECIDGGTVAANATNRAVWKLRAVFSIPSTTSAGVVLEQSRGVPGPANTAQSTAGTTIRHSFQTSAANFVGAGTIEMRFRSDNATATQTFTIHSYRITKIPQRL